MATIKAIEAGTVHRIQSGQVIVDLCSVVKELVENSLDAGATTIDVRFKNQGLESIEVQDNGSGISPDNFDSLALKHHTSKLSTFSDLGTLVTFGFRGEALSSLCALSHFSVTTCLAGHAPRATKLDFEPSGKLRGASVVAGQKGTIVTVSNLFYNLPVRRRELERNIKREWNKVISLLNQYACIQTQLKFTVYQQPNKGKRIVLFSTKGNPSTRDNIMNIFGAKTMTALANMEIELEFQPTVGPTIQNSPPSTRVCVRGFVSRPAHGEGRQTPDRQMFFVNGRPCILPQFAKVFNEVYKSYNMAQSPFIFADIQLDTYLYDVNVSPDKRTILMHEQSRLLTDLRGALIGLFESYDYSIPVSQLSSQKFKLGARAALTPQPHTRLLDHYVPDVAEDDSHPQLDDSKNGTDEGQEDEAGDHDSGCRKTVLSPVEASYSNGENQNLWNTPAKSIIARGTTQQTLLSGQSDKFNGNNKDVARRPSEQASDREATETIQAHSRHSRSRASEDLQPQELVATQHSSQTMLGSSEGVKGKVDLGNAVEGDQSAEVDIANDDLEPPIPGVTPVRPPHEPGSGLQRNVRSPKWTATEAARVTIGKHVVTSLVGSHSKRQPQGSSSSSPSPSQVTDKEDRPAIRASFHKRLGNYLAANSALRRPSLEDPGSDTPSGTSRISSPLGEGTPRGETEDISEMITSEKSTLAHSPTRSRRRASEGHFRDSAASSSVDYSNAEASEGEEAEVVEQQASPGNVLMPVSDRSPSLQRGAKRKDATLPYTQTISVDLAKMQSRAPSKSPRLPMSSQDIRPAKAAESLEATDAEERLSLIISKADFGKMTIVGQFNLGFILAVKHGSVARQSHATPEDDHLFIIDQHASDEKYNFERLQSSTAVLSQRLVHPKRLELTALEEEIVKENISSLELNGFKVRIDESGSWPVGSRCELVALPLSRETIFTLSDLEELISLLGDDHLADADSAPRPSKVRKMFAMRACRSSIMVGKALPQRQMEKLVRHMGELDKPWNCPHGRPTMRHLCVFSDWDRSGWTGDSSPDSEGGTNVRWARYASMEQNG